MATKAKSKSKTAKKLSGRTSASTKSISLKAKRSKSGASNGSRNGSKPTAKTSVRRQAKVARIESRHTSVTASATASTRSTLAERTRSKHFASAIHAYEAAIRLMHAEDFEKAIRCFRDLIVDYPEESEIHERSKVLVHACEKKIQEKGRTVLRSADDHYNVGIADLNRRALESAIEHLQQALKFGPKADHVLYALATANAVK